MELTDQWAALCQAAERRAVAAEQERDAIAAHLADSQAERARVGAAYARLLDQTDTIRQELVRVMGERGAYAGILKLTKERLAEVETKLSEENIAWLKLDGRWARAIRWVARLRHERDEAIRIQEGLMRRCALMRDYCIKMRDGLRAATARERAAREALEKATAQLDEYHEWVEEAMKALPDWMAPVGHAEVHAALEGD